MKNAFSEHLDKRKVAAQSLAADLVPCLEGNELEIKLLKLVDAINVGNHRIERGRIS